MWRVEIRLKIFASKKNLQIVNYSTVEILLKGKYFMVYDFRTWEKIQKYLLEKKIRICLKYLLYTQKNVSVFGTKIYEKKVKKCGMSFTPVIEIIYFQKNIRLCLKYLFYTKFEFSILQGLSLNLHVCFLLLISHLPLWRTVSLSTFLNSKKENFLPLLWVFTLNLGVVWKTFLWVE